MSKFTEFIAMTAVGDTEIETKANTLCFVLKIYKYYYFRLLLDIFPRVFKNYR